MPERTEDFFRGGAALYSQESAIVAEATVPVFTSGSVIDNYSRDAIFVRGVAPQ